MGGFWKVKIGYMSPLRYLLSIALDVLLLAYQSIYSGNSPVSVLYLLIICVNVVFVAEYIMVPVLFDNDLTIRKRYATKAMLNMIAVLAALLAVNSPFVLLLPLLAHRIYYELNLWARNNMFARINDSFLALSLGIMAVMTFTGLGSWDVPTLFIVYTITAVSGLSATMSGKEHALQVGASESKDRIATIHRFLVDSVKLDVMAELGEVSNVCGDPDLAPPPLVAISLENKWKAVRSILASAQTDTFAPVDMKRTVQLVRKSLGAECNLVVTHWRTEDVLVHSGLLAALLRSLAGAALERKKGGNVTVWFTIMAKRILVTDDSGSSTFRQDFVDAVSSKEFQMLSGLDVIFDTPIDGDKGPGAKVTILL